MTSDQPSPVVTAAGRIGVIDIGNTCVKIATFADAKPSSPATVLPLEELPAAALTMLRDVNRVIIGCSGAPSVAQSLADTLCRSKKTALLLSRDMALPFDSSYAPSQAGIDRLANVAAAASGAGSAIIVDAGSAITVDAMQAGGTSDSSKSQDRARFLGGAILPGLTMQARALHARTAALPLIAAPGDAELPGTHTQAAISGGIALGCVGAVDYIINLYRDLPGMADSAVLVTGGDGAFFAAHLAHTGLVFDPLLTLRGFYALGMGEFERQVNQP